MSRLLPLVLTLGVSLAAQSPGPQAPRPQAQRQSIDAEARGLAEPFKGITSNGAAEPGLFAIRSTGVSTAPVRDAAAAFLKALSPEQRGRTAFGVDDDEWRKWMNQHFYVRQGVSFKELDEPQRKGAFTLLRQSLSAKGLKLSRDIMKLNHTLGELNNDFEQYGEWLYHLTVMGEPSATEPWGWQLDGHHLIVNYFVLGDQVVMTPLFVGSEPVTAAAGKFKGTTILQEEQAAGLAMVNALSEEQRKAAIIAPSKSGNNNLTEAWKDNVALDYAGIPVKGLTAAQRSQMLGLVKLFVDNMKEGHARVRMEEVSRHLDRTHFAWVGPTDPSAVFYFPIHSPVILIEFDHQRPANLRGPDVDRSKPSREHIHVVVRTPNGNDYGKDLLRQHYLRHPHSTAPAKDDAARLRTVFFQRDYDTGVAEGAPLAAAASANVQVTTWYLLNLARSGREDQALTAARQLAEKFPEDGWALFALAGALHYKGDLTAEAINTAERALKKLPENADALWLRAQTMAADPKRRAEVVAFVDANRGRVRNPAEMLNTRAYALYSDSFGPPRDEAKLKAAFATFEEAQRIDPANLNAFYLHGTYLESSRRPEEAYTVLKKALALAPGSTAVHQAYWRTVNSHPQFDADRKRTEILADLTSFKRDHGGSAAALLAIASAYGDLKLADEKRQAHDAILARFNDTPQAEWVIVDRWREVEGAERNKDPEYKRLLSEYVARPKHYHMGLLGEAYRNLFFVLAEAKPVPAEELLRVFNGMVKYETTNTHITHASAPIKLADLRLHLADAERVAREGIEVQRKKVEARKSSYKTQGEFEQSLNYSLALGHDAVGWVLFAQGRVDDAEKEMLKGYELNHENRDALHRLGNFYEGKKDIARAEEFYVKGLAVQSPGTNPSEASLRALFEKRTGSAAGFDGYLTELRDADRIRRKEKIIGLRIADPQPVLAFNLKTIDGKRVALADLKGKVVVINFWGIWCGWCVQEMPDVQKLFTQYAADPDVMVLTIDNDKNPDDVAPWMTQKKFTFPVLFDDGYVDKVSVHAFPTTWFLDREGRKVFEKVGWSEKLVEEFSWRIEAIRGASGSAGR